MSINDNINAGTNTVRALKDAIEAGDATLEATLTEILVEIKGLDTSTASEISNSLVALGIPETQDDLLRGIWFTNKAILAELRALRIHLEIINDEEVEVSDAD